MNWEQLCDLPSLGDRDLTCVARQSAVTRGRIIRLRLVGSKLLIGLAGNTMLMIGKDGAREPTWSTHEVDLSLARGPFPFGKDGAIFFEVHNTYVIGSPGDNQSA